MSNAGHLDFFDCQKGNLNRRPVATVSVTYATFAKRNSDPLERNPLEEFGKRSTLSCFGRGMDPRLRKPIWIVVYDGVLYNDFVRDGRRDVRRSPRVKIRTSAKPATLAHQHCFANLSCPFGSYSTVARGIGRSFVEGPLSAFIVANRRGQSCSIRIRTSADSC